MIILCVGAVQELAGATLLHDLSAREPRELAEPIRAVDDGVDGRHLCVAEHEVTVCNTQTTTVSHNYGRRGGGSCGGYQLQTLYGADFVLLIQDY